ANEAVRAMLEAGRPVSIFSEGLAVGVPSGRRGPESQGETSPGTPNMIATSFVGFLIENSSPGALPKFLAAYDLNRRDQAAVEAFQRPLGALEETWLVGLQRRTRTGSVFPIFLRQLG